MELLICILKDYRHVEAVLLGFVELGVTGGTVVEGRGLAQVVGSDHPLFASLRGLFPGSSHDSQVVFSVMATAHVAEAIALIERVTGGLDRPGAGMLFTLPVFNLRGLAHEIA